MFNWGNIQLDNNLNSGALDNLSQAFSNFFGNGGSGVSGGNKDFADIVALVISSILNPVMLLLVAAAIVYFMWGVLTYVQRGEDEGDRAKGINMMWYGIVALFVMISVWGLVNILINTFDLNTSAPPIPKL